MKIEEMLLVPKNRRNRLRPFMKRRKYVSERRKFTREQLIKYLQRNNFRSAYKLGKFRKPGDPTDYDYRKEFGSWETAKTNIFGKDGGIEFDAIYLLKAIIEFNLWTVRSYQAARNKEPLVFPPLKEALKEWGGKFSIMAGAAKQLSFKATLNEYKRLWRKLGRVPSMSEVKAEGIVLDSAISYYKSKKELDIFMEDWENKK